MRTSDLVNQSWWDAEYTRRVASLPTPDEHLARWIRRYIPSSTEGTCFEVGCYPGRYLALLGEMGYVLNGLDRTPHVQSHLSGWLSERGYRIGRIWQDDFLTTTHAAEYDVVLSLGFMEHFTHWQPVLRRTAAFVKPGGYLVVETPNYRGWIQRCLQMIGNPENYRRHNIAAMNPLAWKRRLRPWGFRVLSCGYIGHMEIGVPPTTHSNMLRDAFMWTAYRIIWRLQPRFTRPHWSYSPYAGLIAQRERPE